MEQKLTFLTLLSLVLNSNAQYRMCQLSYPPYFLEIGRRVLKHFVSAAVRAVSFRRPIFANNVTCSQLVMATWPELQKALASSATVTDIAEAEGIGLNLASREANSPECPATHCRIRG